MALLLLAPSMLPPLGRRFRQRTHETQDASVEAGKAFKEEAIQSGDRIGESRSRTETAPSGT
jgi:hypothetical protein